MNLRRTSTRLAATAGLAMLSLSLSGCAYFNPMQTHHFYQPAEGAVANFEVAGPHNPVGARNILITSTGNSATLTGAFSNQTEEDREITIEVSYKGKTVGSHSVKIPAADTVFLGTKDGEAPMELAGFQGKPGENATAKLTVEGQSKDLTVQVLDDSLEYLGDK